MNISFQIEGVETLTQAFGKIERGVIDLRQLGTWDWVESEFYKVEAEIFESAGYGKWPQLSSEYATAKTKRYGGPTRLLIASGAMYKEFTSRAGKVDKQADSMTFEFSSPAGYHMSKAARSKIPYRSSLDLSDEHAARVTAPIGKKLKQLADNAKLRDIRGF